MDDYKDTITPRKLREILYQMDGQWTVRELRNILFDIREQDKEYKIDFSLFHKLMVAAGHHEA